MCTQSPLDADGIRQILEMAPVLIWRANIYAECDFFNESWCVFRGRTAVEEQGLRWVDGIHENDRDVFLERFHDAFDRRETFDTWLRLRRRDDRFRRFLCRGVPLFSATGSFTGYVACFTDVPEAEPLTGADAR